MATLTTAVAEREQPRLAVTVVVPAYESNDTLPRALLSLAEQSVAHEVIIVDDGSTEPVTDAVDTGGAIVLQQANQGAGSARNLGVRHATGAVIAFLDADDVWDRDYLERQLRYLDELPGLAGVICAAHPPHEQAFQGRELVDFLPTLMSLRGGPGTSAWCFRRDALIGAGLFDVAFRRMQDYELLIRMVGKGYAVLRHDEPLYRYLPSIERGNRYSIAHQRALELFAGRYGSDDAAPWLRLRLDANRRRSIRALMRTRAMNVAALRGDEEGVRALAGAARDDLASLPHARRAQVVAASRAPGAYSRILQHRF